MSFDSVYVCIHLCFAASCDAATTLFARIYRLISDCLLVWLFKEIDHRTHTQHTNASSSCPSYRRSLLSCSSFCGSEGVAKKKKRTLWPSRPIEGAPMSRTCRSIAAIGPAAASSTLRVRNVVPHPSLILLRPFTAVASRELLNE